MPSRFDPKAVPAEDVTLEPEFTFDEDRPLPQKQETLSLTRYPKFTEENRKKVLMVLMMGLNLKTAAGHIGVTVGTLKGWIDKGRIVGEQAEGDERVFHEFYMSCEEARSSNAIYLTNLQMSHAIADPRANEWLLKNLHPDQFGADSKRRIEHTGPGGGPLRSQVEIRQRIADLPNEDIDRLIGIYNRAVFEDKRDKALDSGDYIDAEVVEGA